MNLLLGNYSVYVIVTLLGFLSAGCFNCVAHMPEHAYACMDLGGREPIWQLTDTIMIYDLITSDVIFSLLILDCFKG